MTRPSQQTAVVPPNSPSSARSAVDVSPLRVLFVDDNADIRESLSLNLGDEGFAVVTFADGPSALGFLDGGESVDVILLDWRMPGMSGLEVLRELRRRDIRTPVIFLSGLGDEPCEEVTAPAGGAIEFVSKSCRPSVLMKRIELVVEGRRPPAHPDPSGEPA